jgi:hypothetical protein
VIRYHDCFYLWLFYLFLPVMRGRPMDSNTVLEAIAEIEAMGEPITVRAVHQRTKGSMRDVSYYVGQWREYRLIPKTNWERLEEQVDDLRASVTAHPGDARLHGHLKEMTAMLLQVVRTLHNESLRPKPAPAPAVRYATRRERAAHNKAQWAEIKDIKRLLRMRYG